MPDLSPEVLLDIAERLERHLASRAGYHTPLYVACGGSAATYSVSTPAGKRCIKVYDPKFLKGATSEAEKRRLELQRGLIGHNCEQLVTIYAVDEAEDTAFVEMEFIEWPQLKKTLANVPEQHVSTIIRELVVAVTFLEKLGIVHRDIKPENIHVSPDFTKLKLLDLGVARGIDPQESDSGAGTDQGQTRPFISTAQYSSPEYLFRLDEPSPALWKALNLYQVGAVLHDLINKRPLFQDEVDKQNRWLVARAVLDKTPSFPDADPSRLARQKALASRCLVKDGAIRLQIASWNDFEFEAPANGLSSLHAKLTKGKGTAGAQLLAASRHKLEFERSGAAKRLCDSIKAELIVACCQQIRLSMYPLESATTHAYVYEFSISEAVTLHCTLSLSWNDDLQSETATVATAATVIVGSKPANKTAKVPLAVFAIGKSEDVTALDVANNIAAMLAFAIDLVAAAGDKDTLHGADVATDYRTTE
ncbi:protein kinase [Stenotrophomonas maltophilia]|uniref:protein kinase domain-containing protein n=1 Tax=Stenotrophomonas maltophilia TaxID=40324 RepID=UPI0021C7120C|nr:protein kinase [Stenotrophomonas maltophilia]MCU1127907.1 protein kinase [Stenotrophomonas maltophilia]